MVVGTGEQSFHRGFYSSFGLLYCKKGGYIPEILAQGQNDKLPDCCLLAVMMHPKMKAFLGPTWTNFRTQQFALLVEWPSPTDIE